MKQLNPLWSNSTNGNEIDSAGERMSASFYEQGKYGTCKNNTYSTYAIGAPPIEMWIKAYSIYKNKYEASNSTIGCDILDAYGYGYRINGGSLGKVQQLTVVNSNIEKSKVFVTTSGLQWLASPAGGGSNVACCVSTTAVTSGNGSGLGFCPVVPLNQ